MRVFLVYLLIVFTGLSAVCAKSMLPEGVRPWDEIVGGDDQTKGREVQSLNMQSSKNINLPRSIKMTGVDQLQDILVRGMGTIFRYLLISISILYIIIEVSVIIINSDDETILKQGKDGTIYALIGLVIISFSSEIASVFDAQVYANDANKEIIGSIAKSKYITKLIVNFLTLISNIAAYSYLLFYGVVLVLSSGVENTVTDTKAKILNGFIGIIVVTMASAVVNTLLYNTDQNRLEAPVKANITSFSYEIISMVNYFLGFVSIVSIIILMILGASYLIDVNESFSELRKSVFRNLIIGFIIISLSYVLTSSMIFS